MDTESASSRKAALRRQVRAMLREMPCPLPNVSGTITAWLREHPELHRIALFAPLSGEPNLLPLLESLPDRVWCFPRVVDEHRLAFHDVSDAGSTLRPATLGILEPSVEAPETAIEGIDAFLCPGLAFDRDGGRLGRGRGYYDRMLADAREDSVKVGACFACQLVDSTFPEAHDMRMDLVIAEFGPITLC